MNIDMCQKTLREATTNFQLRRGWKHRPNCEMDTIRPARYGPGDLRKRGRAGDHERRGRRKRQSKKGYSKSRTWKPNTAEHCAPSCPPHFRIPPVPIALAQQRETWGTALKRRCLADRSAWTWLRMSWRSGKGLSIFSTPCRKGAIIVILFCSGGDGCRELISTWPDGGGSLAGVTV
jgi:hypothetical protein